MACFLDHSTVASGRPQDFAALSAGADAYAGWIAQTKAEFRAKTGAGQ